MGATTLEDNRGFGTLHSDTVHVLRVTSSGLRNRPIPILTVFFSMPSFTDPPYYDNVPYSHLSDYLLRLAKTDIRQIFIPNLFSTPLTPKRNEIVAYSHEPGGLEEGKRFVRGIAQTIFSGDTPRSET